MSSPPAGSPPSGSAGGGPGPNWYPDPSIPGYIRYWNGTAWVPGSSRPEPREGEPVPTPPSGAASAPAAAPAVPAARAGETQPFFFDEDPPPAAEPGAGSALARSGGDALPEVRRRGDVAPAGGGQEPGAGSAPAWPAAGGAAAQPAAGPDTPSQDSGDRRVTWGSDEDVSTSPVAAAGRVDPRGQFRQPSAEGSQPPARRPEPQAAPAPAPKAAPEPDAKEETTTLRRSDIAAAGGSWERQVRDLAQQAPPGAPQGAPPRAVPAQTGGPAPAAPPAQPAPGQAPGGVPPQAGPPARQAQPQGFPQQPQPQPPQGPRPGYGYPPQQQPGPGGPGAPGGYGYPPQQPHHQQQQPPQAQQSPFLQSHQGEALTMVRRFQTTQAYPASLGRRLMARLVDSVFSVGAAAAVGWPLLGDARDHIDEQVDAAERAGVTETIWLIDGTTGGYLAMVIGVFLGVGLLFEALPTALWARTPGKALFGLRVLDLQQQEKPGFGAALLRWLVYSLLGVLVVGIVNVLWALRDRPWRQCWHDKAADTFVATMKAPGSQD
ncbi:RDD family protein [Streptomyces sp. MP131-18]|uniref:RDD family protein n=1 Tax=Streptomyces sp. MP131-18 TaxID=1857892 RepID=UPI00097C3EDA|nr:RDD family protein [Streptomyces sp. MP131-18]ONK13967.1 RDD family protein [Streptomyces sp. MP131-18]